VLIEVLRYHIPQVVSPAWEKGTGLKTRHYKGKTGRGSDAQGGGGGEGGVEAEIGAVEEGGEFGEAESEAFRRGGTEGDVAEFAAGPRGFAVEMEVGVGDG